MGAYIRKTDGLAREVAPYLPITCRIADLFLDMNESAWTKGKATEGQVRRLEVLTAEAYAQVAAGLIQLVSHLPRRPVASPAWYGRDEANQPLPAVLPRTYRIGGCRVA